MIPFLDFLDELGAPVDRALEQGHLPLHLREMPGCFVATKLNWDFVGRMARQEDIDDLGLRVGYEAGRVAPRPKLVHPPLSLPQPRPGTADLLQERVFEKAPACAAGSRQTKLEVELHLRKTFGPTTRGYRQTEWLGLMAMVGVVQLFMGPGWEPTSISLRSVGPVPDLAHELFPTTRFLTGQARVALAFPREALNHPRGSTDGSPRFEWPASWKSQVFDESPAEGLFGALAQSLEPYLADRYPDVTLGARIADMSVRTLQRRLHIAGVTYSTVVDQARFQIASKQLATSARPSKEIAESLGYSDASHFARAFRRLTGLSPQEYRQQCRQEAQQRAGQDARQLE